MLVAHATRFKVMKGDMAALEIPTGQPTTLAMALHSLSV